MLGDHILEKSWAFQEIKQEGREEGIKQGLQPLLQPGLQQEILALRKVLVSAVQAHYPTQVALATRKAQEISNPDILQAAILQLLTASHEDEVQHILLAMEPEAE